MADVRPQSVINSLQASAITLSSFFLDFEGQMKAKEAKIAELTAKVVELEDRLKER